jgi:hypothetical protein
MVQVEFVKSGVSSCIVVNGTRVTNGKSYGFGHTVACCHINKDRLRKLIEGKETVQIYVVDNACKGIWVDGVNISRKGKKIDYDEHLKRVAELRKKCSKKYHPKLLQELRDMDYWTVKTENIEEALN